MSMTREARMREKPSQTRSQESPWYGQSTRWKERVSCKSAGPALGDHENREDTERGRGVGRALHSDCVLG